MADAHFRRAVAAAADLLGKEISDERLEHTRRIAGVLTDVLEALLEVPADQRGTALGAAFAMAEVSNRVTPGQCPVCREMQNDLADHMQKEHPGWAEHD